MIEKEVGAFGQQGQVEYNEHSSLSRAKKVISGPLASPKDAINELRSAVPAHVAFTVATDFTSLKPDTAYRVISDVAFCFVQYNGTTINATTSDTYVPANTPIVLRTDLFRNFNAIPFSGTGFIQAVEVK